MKYRYITLDSVDGVGKTTALNRLDNRLACLGYRVKKTRGLGGDGSSFIQNELRKLLLSPEFPPDQTLIEERIFSVSDLQNVEMMMQYLSEGLNNLVISDRAHISHITYFKAKGFGDSTIGHIHKDLFDAYAEAASRFGLLNIVFLPEDSTMSLERVKSRGGLITPRLENSKMQSAVLEVLLGKDDMFASYPVLHENPRIKNVYITVTRQDSIEDVSAKVWAEVSPLLAE